MSGSFSAFTTDAARVAILSMATRGTADIQNAIRPWFPSDVEVDGFAFFCLSQGWRMIDEGAVNAWMRGLYAHERDAWIEAAFRSAMIEEFLNAILREDPGMDGECAMEDACERYDSLSAPTKLALREEKRRAAPFIRDGDPPKGGSVGRAVYLYPCDVGRRKGGASYSRTW